jgi:peroxiredoxin
MYRYGLLLLILAFVGSAAPCSGQNVTDYNTMAEPLLFLLREPAVLRDLALTREQRSQLTALNEKYDGELLSTRNVPPEQGYPRVAKVLTASRDAVASMLDGQQRTRLRQLTYRVRGISFVLNPDAAAELKLTADQQERIENIIRTTRKRIADLQHELREAKTSAQEATDLANEARTDEQLKVFEQLTDSQRKTLVALIGPPFDLAELGHVSFKAPEFSSKGTWINSPPLQLTSLRGQVVVVHFYAFGCINCIHNYEWYRHWQDKYANQPVTIVGVHTPETEAERNIEQVRAKARKESFRFPIVVDNDRATWDAWGNSMWPSVYLIDRQGRLRYWWYGELNWQGAGGQEIMARRIDQLLAETAAAPVSAIESFRRP